MTVEAITRDTSAAVRNPTINIWVNRDPSPMIEPLYFASGSTVGVLLIGPGDLIINRGAVGWSVVSAGDWTKQGSGTEDVPTTLRDRDRATIGELEALEDGWNGPETRRPSRAAMAVVVALFARLSSTKTPSPAVFPSEAGGIDLSWATIKRDRLAVEITYEGWMRFSEGRRTSAGRLVTTAASPTSVAALVSRAATLRR